MNVKTKTLLVASLISTATLKYVSKQEMKVADRIIPQAESLKTPIRNIIIADNFKHDVVDINGDFMSDVPHGVVINKIIEQGLPNANLYNYNVFTSSESDKANVLENLKDLFSKVLGEIKSGKFYDAINLSLGFSVQYKALSNAIGMDIDSQNVKQQAKEIKKQLLKPENDYKRNVIPMKKVIEVVNLMDSISSNGTKFYISAGNSSDGQLNLLSLADNSYIIGALDKYGHFATYSDKNTLVNGWAYGDIEPKKVPGGYDITGNGELDIKNKNTTGLFHFTPLFNLASGTSFAAPRKLVEDFSKKK